MAEEMPGVRLHALGYLGYEGVDPAVTAFVQSRNDEIDEARIPMPKKPHSKRSAYCPECRLKWAFCDCESTDDLVAGGQQHGHHIDSMPVERNGPAPTPPLSTVVHKTSGTRPPKAKKQKPLVSEPNVSYDDEDFESYFDRAFKPKRGKRHGVARTRR